MTQLIPFDEHDVSSVPAHLQSTFGAPDASDLSGGVNAGYPVLSFKGKAWSLREGGESTLILRPDNSGEPAASLEVVLVKANPRLSKVYYDSGYVEGSDAKPTCYSNTGISPESDATAPQCVTCAACPHNAWGSRIAENGSKGKACADSRRVAVVSAGELDRPMLLRVPAASLKGLAAFADTLARRNAPYQAVVTRVGFDHTVAHPQLTFKPVRWLNAQEAATLAQTMASSVTEQITGTSPYSGAVRPVDDGLGEAPAHAQIAPVVKPAPVVTAAVVAAPVVAAQPTPSAPKARAPRTPRTLPPAAAPVVEAPAPVAPAAPAKRAPSFAAPAPDVKPAPEPSRAATQMTAATDDLEAALAELDDI